MMGEQQLDLFGQVEAEATEAAERKAAYDALAPRWRDWLHAEPAPYPYDTQGGGKAGEVCDDWWRCPGCGAVELGAYPFWLAHGFHPDHAGDVPWAWRSHGGCHRTINHTEKALGAPGTEPR
ncbi:hypothetical protein [Nocardioides zeae]